MIEDGHELVNVSDLNQYLYCPRRLYYIRFFDTIGLNADLVSGRLRHQNLSRRGGWILERYLYSERLCLHGKVDLIEDDNGPVPVERKSGIRVYDNDRIQLAAYALLIEEWYECEISIGYIYLFSTRRRFEVVISDDLRDSVSATVQAILSMKLTDIPPIQNNLNKCKRCSVLSYCLPHESRIVGEV